MKKDDFESFLLSRPGVKVGIRDWRKAFMMDGGNASGFDNNTLYEMGNKTVRVEISPAVYLALCGLVKDALEVDSDAAPVLQRAAVELAQAIENNPNVPEIVQRAAEAITDLSQEATRASKKAVA